MKFGKLKTLKHGCVILMGFSECVQLNPNGWNLEYSNFYSRTTQTSDKPII